MIVGAIGSDANQADVATIRKACVDLELPAEEKVAQPDVRCGAEMLVEVVGIAP